MGRIVLVCAFTAGCAAAPLPPPEPLPPAPVADMPEEVRALLEHRCAGCHVNGPSDVAGWGSVLDVPRMIEARILVPGDPRHSPLIAQLQVGEMPRKGPRLRAPEVELLERWIGGLVPAVLGSLK